MESQHYSVLLREAIDALVIDPDGLYVDGTFGRGGHSRLLLERLSAKGRLIAFDKDPEAIAVGQSLSAEDSRFEIVQDSFAQWGACLKARGLEATGLLLDLGVSSPQLDQAERGFSFMNDGPLDMRMNPDAGLSAADWLAQATEAEITYAFKVYGEERFAKRMAKAIIAERQENPLTRTLQLAKLLTDANPAWEKHKHPATRAFQGLRIQVNNELGDLEDALAQIPKQLKIGGRLVAISFHSLEDRIVKLFIRAGEKGDEPPRGVPITDDQINRTLRKVGKAVKAGDSELDENIRSRSAVMRIAERLA